MAFNRASTESNGVPASLPSDPGTKNHQKNMKGREEVQIVNKNIYV